MVKKERLDKLLVERAMVESREKARALIMAGKVLVDEVVRDKVASLVPPHSRIRIKGKGLTYVSRGGEKLDFALDKFQIKVKDKVAIDVGASTGGFTDCLLKRGVRLVYALDVGYGQLAWQLRKNPRVVVIERTNIRYLDEKRIPVPLDLSTIDVSFISLTLVLPKVISLVKEGGDILALIKPQFELEPHDIGRGGVVRGELKLRRAIEKIKNFSLSHKVKIGGVVESPIKGAKGNREFFIHLRL